MIVLDPYFPAVANLIFGAFVMAICQKRGNWLFGTFIFTSLFFAYSILPLIIQLTDTKHYWIKHLQPVGLHMVVVVFFSGILLASIVSSPISTTRFFLNQLPRLPVFSLVFFAVSIPFVYLQHIENGGGASLQIKGMISTFGMVVVALALAILARNDQRLSQYHMQNMYWVLFSVLALSTAVAFWEVASQNAWVVNNFRGNLVEYRASSIFRNPNVFAAWVSIITLAASYAALHKILYLVHPILALTAVAIFLSGSRSVLALTLVCLALPIALALVFRLSMRMAVVSLATFIFYFFMTTAIALILGGHFGISGATTSFFSGFYVLSVRFISIPSDLLNYVQGTGVAHHIGTSIDGRFFIGDTVDNGHLAFISDGWVSYITAGCWVLFLISIAWAGLRKLALSPSQNGIYAVTALTYFVLISFIMRAYQIFPINAFLALILSLFLIWYLNNDERSYT